MKALLFIPQLDRGGPDRVFSELALGLPTAGVDIELLVQSSGGYYWDRLPTSIEKSVLSFDSRSAAKSFPVMSFSEHVRKSKPDVVLCTLRSLLTASAASIMRRVSVPIVIRPANHLTRNGLELMRKSPIKHGVSWLANIATLHSAAQVICQSQDLYRDFRRYGVPRRRLTVVGNPIELPSDDRRAALVNQSRLEGSPALVAIGRLMPQKGFDVLIDAVALLRDRLPTITLRIFGEGPDHAALEQRIQMRNLVGRVSLEGFCGDVERPLVGADFLVSSSRYEGFPNVILEALSWGTPVVATDCPGGTSELVIEGKTGWLCRPESATSLADCLEMAYRSKRPSSAKLRQFVDERYATNKVVQAYADVLRRAATSHRD